MGTIADKLNYLNETKQQMKETLRNNGVEVSDEDTFRSYVEKMSEMQGGISQEEYDSVVSQKNELQTQVNTLVPQKEKLQSEINVIKPDYEYSVDLLDEAYLLANNINGEEVQ